MDSLGRIAVTGLGAVSAWGWGVPALRRGLERGRTAIRSFRRFDHASQRTHVAGEVPDPEPADGFSSALGSRWSCADRFALAAATEAVRQAGLDLADEPAAGVYFASSTAGLYESECYLAKQWRGGRARLGLWASQQLNGPGDAVARRLRIQGPVVTYSSACASATLALEAALHDLRDGVVEVALAGGSDALCEITYSGFNALRAVDDVPCRPFRRARRGMSLGEGAAVLVLESGQHAARRGQAPLAEFRGAGSSCDANHMTAPHPEGRGAALAAGRALRDAGVPPEGVAFVNVHGTGTPLNDDAEYRALRAVFGDAASAVPLTATKASVGHLLGAAGAIEAVATVLSLHRGVLDPTAAGGELDPAMLVDLVEDAPRPLGKGAGLSLNLAFGGANAALVFDHWTD